MERESKKRLRGEEEDQSFGMNSTNHHQKQKQKQKQKQSDGLVLPKLATSPANPCRPLGVFDFPWQGRLVMASPELDGCDLRDVFFCSLVDGSSAKIGLPGDRLGRAPAPFSLLSEDGSWPFDEEMDGVDCIWSAVLRQPLLAARPGKVSNV